MKVITLNVNGIRSAAEKGFFSWMLQQDADVVCLQNIQAQEYQLDAAIFHPEGYHVYFCDATEPDFGGTAIYCKPQPKAIMTGLAFEQCDMEGRFIQADFDKISISSLYIPEGSNSDPEVQQRKYDFMEQVHAHLKKTLRKRREFIFCGTLNVAAQPRDVSSWYVNQKNSGFLPDERRWINDIFKGLAYVDAFRAVNQQEEQYTWWPEYDRAWKLNAGGRLDYQVATPNLRKYVDYAEIYRKERFSDHAPVIVDYSCDL